MHAATNFAAEDKRSQGSTEGSRNKVMEKKKKPGSCSEEQSAALLQRAARRPLMPEKKQKTHRIYNGGTIIHTKRMQRTAKLKSEPPSAFFLCVCVCEVKTLQKEKFNLIG